MVCVQKATLLATVGSTKSAVAKVYAKGFAR